jgi:hypothetical protein
VKFAFGVMVGAALLWFYRSDQGRNQAKQQLDTAPERLQKLRQTAAAETSKCVQRVSEMIAAAPLPERVKSAAGELAVNATNVAESIGKQGKQVAPEEAAASESAS